MDFFVLFTAVYWHFEFFVGRLPSTRFRNFFTFYYVSSIYYLIYRSMFKNWMFLVYCAILCKLYTLQWESGPVSQMVLLHF